MVDKFDKLSSSSELKNKVSSANFSWLILTFDLPTISGLNRETSTALSTNLLKVSTVIVNKMGIKDFLA